jgi:hypothetical protein
MAGRQRKRAPIRCPECGERSEWTKVPDYGELYQCVACGTWTREEDAPPPDDGRIRSPDDVEPRVEGARQRAAADARLSELDREVHGLYCDVAIENTSVEVMAADTWVAEELGLGERGRTSVRRSRARLEALGYVRRLQVKDVTRYGLKAAVAASTARGRRPATLLEVRKAPPLPECEVCGETIADGLRVWRRYCSARCRQAAHRARASVLADA